MKLMLDKKDAIDMEKLLIILTALGLDTTEVESEIAKRKHVVKSKSVIKAELKARFK